MTSIVSLTSASNATENAVLIQEAIDRCTAKGGGKVVIPVGTWSTTSLRLHSGIELHLPANATLTAAPDITLYPALTTLDENKDRQPYHLIIAEDCEHVSITGEGTIDGNGFAFWNPPMQDLTREGIDVDAYCDEHGLPDVYRKANHPWYREKTARPSPMFEFKHVKCLRMRGVRITNSPGWTVHCHNSEDLVFDGITIANCLYGPNTDGLDINGCCDVRISNCDLTCGDDAIILKAMKDAGNCERIAVSNCIISTNCAAMGLGAETAHTIRDVVFSNCVIRQALRAFQIEMWEPGLIENVVVTNIAGRTGTEIPLQRALYIDIQHHMRTDGALGRCRNIQFSNVCLTTRGRCVFTAADGSEIENVVLRDVHLMYETIENAAETVPQYASSQMSNDSPEARAVNAAVVASNCLRLQLLNVITTWPGEGSNIDGDPTANSELNPHHNDPAMHGAWLRHCAETVIDSPFLTAFAGNDGGEPPARIYELS